MMDGGTAAFLQQAHRNNWQQYLASLQPGARRRWDLCILTASDTRQAAMYRRQLDWRREAGLLPMRTQFHVLPDPGGRRIGSGGATLRALSHLDTLPRSGDHSDGEPRVLIIHSGGDARRLPHCSAIGKLFARVPRELPDGRTSTIFDEFLISLSGLAAGLPGGALIAAGDVLLGFDHLQLTFRRAGVIGVAAAAPVEMGTRHGVYISSASSRRVRAYLHKLTAADLTQWDAVAPDQTVQIDTGLVWLDHSTVSKLRRLAQAPQIAALLREEAPVSAFADGTFKTAGAPPNGQPGLNLYGDLLLPLADSTQFDAYLVDTSDGQATPEIQAARRMIWEQLRETPFTVERLQPATFMHFGTSQEYWHMVAGDPDLAHLCGWHLPADTGAGLALLDAIVESSDLPTPPNRPALVVDSYLTGPLAWQAAALIANVETNQPIALGADLVLHQLPVAGGYVTRLFGIQDDPKLSLDDPAATFLNRPWAEWLGADAALLTALWPDGSLAERTLWTARLHPFAMQRDESLALALALQAGLTLTAERRARWLAAPRLSLAESFQQADGERILAETVALEDAVAVRRFWRAIVAEQPASQVKGMLGRAESTIQRRGRQAGERFAAADPILQLRGYTDLAHTTGDMTWEERAFAVLATMVEDATLHMAHSRVARSNATRSSMHSVRAAARIDFGGGWTDTPPYSIERGGTVLNAAVTLRGRHPILAEAEHLVEPKLILDSRDIEAILTPTRVGDILAYANPADPFALLKAALVLRGIVTPDQDAARPLADLFRQIGGGLRLSTQTFIPRGSGLGTSSIMAGAVLTALARWLGIELSQAQLFDEVLCLEQMLTTGGGWQDQVGGLTGGVKLVTTPPGLPQVIQVTPIALSPEIAAGLAGQLVLVYTGQQRLAKNLLRNVVGRWMARDPEMVWIQGELVRLAVAMRAALTSGDLRAFGQLLTDHWVQNKRMDPGCTNPFINDLFEGMSPYVWGGKLAGAGGGGYAMLIARDIQAASDLEAALVQRYPGTPVAVWPCAIPEKGLQIDSSFTF